MPGAIMTQREDVLKFEQGRIRALQEERLHIQKKTFTKWMNSFLQKARMDVEDLFTDLADGKKLLKLLEIISGEKLGKPNNGRMRVHKVENVNKSLAFLHTKVRLESIGAEDIVDGNPRLILGLIWTIILRFQIQEIEIDVDEENESSEKKSAKDALLLWCQRKTNGYPGVSIHDFTSSWRSGLGFNALIHAHRPDLIDFSSLQPQKHIDNLNNAFDTASNHLGIPSLLDAEDVDTSRPDEKSIITYVASYYHTFARIKNEMKSGRRIANIVGQMMDADNMKIHYERLTSDLLRWIQLKIAELEDRTFPNSLEGIQKELLSFKQYRTVEKPPKYKERSEIEALYFHINTQLKSLNQPAFAPQDGQLIHDLERNWEQLERAEHRREVALRQELLRQERLEQLNYKFERKSVLREGYLKEMIHVLADPRYGSNLSQVDATIKKHEAISADIMAREERFNDLVSMSAELVREKYHGAQRVKERESEVIQRWHQLLEMLEKHKANLTLLCSLMMTIREIDTIMATITELQGNFQSQDVGPHLLAVEDLLQKHSLMEVQVTAIGETQRRLGRQCQQHVNNGHKETPTMQARLDAFNTAYDNLVESSKQRRARLENARNYYQFVQDHEDEEGWLVEKQRVCKTGISAKDLRAVLSLQQKHKALQDEMNVRRPKSEQVCESGRRLVESKHPKLDDINARIESLTGHWSTLNDLVALRKKQLGDAAEAFQFYADANEAESWLNEKMAIVASSDYGEDEPSAQALLQRHRDLQGELNAYNGDIQSLNGQADKLIKAGIPTLPLAAEPVAVSETSGDEEWVDEVRLVPQEVWKDEPVERIEYKTVVEDRLIPQVRSLYAFKGQDIEMEKGEVMFLLNKTNSDWWNVRKANGQDGFVPAKYVREIEPKTIPVQVRVQEKVTEMRKVRKVRMVKKVVPTRKQRTAASQIENANAKEAADDSQNVEKRVTKINDTYKELQELASRRHALLEDSIRLFGFYRECDDFEKWIRDKEKMLRTDDGTDTVETAKRKYETIITKEVYTLEEEYIEEDHVKLKFLTDLSASGKRVEALDTAVDDFVTQGHSQLDKVRARQRQIHQLWEHLNWLKGQKERSLEGASSVELFHRTCDEARDWMQEKMSQLDIAELGADLKTVQALQRRHLHLERELAPVQEKVNRVTHLASSVSASYPNEKANVDARRAEVQELWGKVKAKADERRSRLEDAVGHQIFINSSKNLLNWASSVKEALNSDETARDVATAENLLKKHQELGDDIEAHNDEFREVSALGKQLLQRNNSLNEVATRLTRLAQEQQSVAQMWGERGDWLYQCSDLQLFNKEADHIDASTSSHEAFLEFTDLGGTIDDVEALLKRHEDFENTLAAQDDRLKVFSEMADKLIAAEHYDSKAIDERRKQVLARRQAVKESANKRRVALLASHSFQEFCANSDDLRVWLADKLRTAGDESYRDLSNLERKLQKHEAFERELRSNEGQLRNVNKMGQALVSEGNYRSPEVAEILKGLNSSWEELVQLSRDKGRRLRQAAAQRTYNRTLEDARVKLDEIESELESRTVGADLRHCKQLLKKHQVLESEMYQWEQRIESLVSTGQEMAHEGHFDADNILKASKECQKKFASLNAPARAKRAALEESLRFHKFGFELEAELAWIREHAPLAASDTLGTNLHQAQSLHKKHKKMESEILGHQPMIDRTLASGQALIDQGHPEQKQIEQLCDQLKDAWVELGKQAAERARKLDLSLKAQQFFFEAGEVESWLTERNDVLSSTDYGRDRDAATKLLTKHKALELELDSYRGIVNEMGHAANAMVTAKHPDAKAIHNKQQMLSQQMHTLQRLATARQQRLMESMFRHEYLLESAELEQWIREQSQIAASEDYGQDYEHLQILQNKFDDLKRSIEAGSERFNQCEDLAKKLITNESPYIEEIEKRQAQLSGSAPQATSKPADASTGDVSTGDVSTGDASRSGIDLHSDDPVYQVTERQIANKEAWKDLLAQMSYRERRLAAAGEIHRFHRDVAEAMARITEKTAAIPDDRGKSLNSVLALLRRHEGFENDLLALEAQLQVLLEDAVRLQALYPGNNATQIGNQQTVVLANWAALQERSAQRREELNASCDLQRFLTQVRDLLNWASGLHATMLTEEKVRDAAGAQTLKAEHEAVKAEIEAREDNFKTVVEMGEDMVKNHHYASQEIRKRSEQVLEERQKLHAAWHHKKVHLDQLIDLHFFLRDAKQIDSISSSQEVALTGTDFGHSVDEVTTAMKKHDAFEKLLVTQEEKVTALQEHGDKLLAQRHFESETIEQRLTAVMERRARVRELCQKRRERLEDALLHAQFIRDVGEAELWIDEKQKKLEAEASKGETNSLEEKIKKLQKHQAFQAELTANQSRINEIQQKGELLLGKKHKASRDVRAQLDQLLEAWRTLLQESSNHGRGLEEAQDILEFNIQVEKIEAWIRDKEMMVQAADTGRDYEHCLALQRKLDDVDSDMRVDDARIRSINSLADKLIRQGRSDTRSVDQRRDQFNSKWRGLQGALGEYRERLAGSLEIHLFNRDVDDTAQRVAEKAVAMSSDDTGRDLAAVEQLQRKQDTLERDMTAIEGKLKEHEAEMRRLAQKYPDMAVPIRDKLSALTDDWRNLQQLTKGRHDALAAAYTRHKFRAELHEVEVWVGEAIKRMESSEQPSTVSEAEAMVQLHQEHKAEIDGRQEAFKALKEFGLKVPEASGDLARLEELRRTLGAAWEDRKHRLTQAHQLQLFREQTDQIHSWLGTKEAFLNNDDLGDSLSSVGLLLRKHEDFEKTLTAQLGRVEDLEKFALEILSDHHYDSQAITQRLQGVITRRDRLKEAAAARRKKLQESRQLHQFLRNMYEVENWLNQKLQVANDESYRDPTNLQSKIQRHAAFEAEVAANRARVGNVTTEGEGLIGAGHFASMEIRVRLDDLEALWRQLQDSSQLKRERLSDAYQALLFSRTLEEFESWMDDVESQLASEDHGKDLASVANLLKRHSLLESDVTSHGETCEQVKDTAAAFQRSNHFMEDEIRDRAAAAITRYRSLQEPMQIRRDNLQDALLLHQFQRDLFDELQWLAEKEPQAASQDLGASLTAVQSLQKKHQALEAEIISREPVVTSLVNRAQQMISAKHFEASRIESMSNELQERLGHVRDLASVRRLRLLDAVESQQFYAEAAEAETWMREKRPILASTDYGKDEDSVISFQKKMESMERDLSAFQHTVGALAKLAGGLVDRGHFDSSNIKNKQAELEEKFAELQTLRKVRESRLAESRKLFRFLREADEVAEWIGDQTTVAASEDYGRDVEHVELLIQTFETFLSGLSASEGRVSACLASGKTLIAEGNPQQKRIQSKLDETTQLWDDLKELAHARQEALAGAKQVHVFDRTADETISWIQEKDALLSSEGYGQDLETIQALVRKHQGFETDLEAVKEQVESVREEAGRLAELFPDAREHIEVKHEEATDSWAELLEKAEQRRDKLQQAEQLQAYFDQYRDLMSWINEMIAKVTAPELAQDVPGAEALISRHVEHKAEIDTRVDAFDKFYSTGKQLISQGHFLSGEIEDKISVLEHRRNTLNDTWYQRKIIYDQNLDTQMFKRDASHLENWLQSREPTLRDSNLGESIPQVDELIRKHDDFIKTIEAQEEKFNALRRITMLEEAFQKQQQAEQIARQAERERLEKERVEARKRKEVQRITDERRREEERRRAQDPRLGREDRNGVSDLDNLSQMEIDPQTTATEQESAPSAKTEGNRLEEGAHGLARSHSIASADVRTSTMDSPDSGSHKSSSISAMFGDKLRKDVKRSESMRVDLKKPKRTPSFTTRRRTQSFRKLQRLDHVDQLPPVEIEGILDRKHELQGGGKKAAVRSWKTFYTVLCGQLLCFFKDQDDFFDSKAATSPVSIFKARCEKADNYTKRKHVFRLCCTDGSVFLFLAQTEADMTDWVNKIKFHADLPPSLQLLSYDESKGPGALDRIPSHLDVSSGSSRGSSPEPNPYSGTVPQSLPQGGPLPQGAPMPPPREPVPHRSSTLPPAYGAPRGAPPPIPVRSPTTEITRMRQENDVGLPPRPHSFHPVNRGPRGALHQQPLAHQNGDTGRRSYPELASPQQESPPPLPSTAPPNRPPVGLQTGGIGDQLPHRDNWDHSAQPIYRNVEMQGKQAREAVVVPIGNRPNSLPPYVAPPPAGASPYNPIQRRPSESSSESEQAGGKSRSGSSSEAKRRGVLSTLFGRNKRATHLQ